MGLPGVGFTVKNGGLGILPSLPGQTVLCLGTAKTGPTDSIVPIAGLPQAKTTYTTGPLLEAVAQVLQVANQVLAYNIFSGTWGAVTPGGGNTSTSVLTLSGSPMGNYSALTVKVTSAGSNTVASGNAIISYQLTASSPFSPNVAVPANGVLAIPNTGTTFNFTTAAGATLVNGDTFTAAVTPATGSASTVSHVGSGSGSLTTASSTPYDAYSVVVTIIATGNNTGATFTYSSDGGRTPSPVVTAAATYSIPNTGVLLNFTSGGAGAYVAGDTYSFTTQGPGYTTTDLSNSLTAILANPILWGAIFIVGQPSSSANCASLISTMDSFCTTAFTNNRFVMALIEAPPDSAQFPIDATLIAATTSTSSDFVSVGAGDCNPVSPAFGWQISRSAAWPEAVRIAQDPVGHDLGAVVDGNLVGIANLLRDENATPGLDAARFSTCRTFFGFPGFYLTNGRIFSTPTSDFQYVQHRRVMNQACTAALPVLTLLVNSSVRINQTTGQINAADAAKIEIEVADAVVQAIVQNGQASAVTVTVDRSHNILSDSHLPVSISIVPLGYAKNIDVTIQFVNPALQQAVQAAA